MNNNDVDFNQNNFDLLRLAAALQVVFLHGVKHLEIPIHDSIISVISIFPGVPIFFVISGFLISASYERSKGIYSYFWNRFLRIFPGLWACFLFSLIVLFGFYDPVVGIGKFLIWVFSQLTIGQFYNPEFIRDFGVGVLNGSLWTIPVELQFYLVLPLIYLVFFGHAKRYFLFFFLFAIFLCFNYLNNDWEWDGRGFLGRLYGVSVLPYLYMFLCGILIQRYFDVLSFYLKNKFFYLLFLYLIINLSFSLLGLNAEGNSIGPIPFFFLALLSISFAYSFRGRLGNFLRDNDLSYGVYIYHMLFVNIAVHQSFLHSYAILVIIILMTIGMAFLSWKLVEKPSLKLKKYSLFKRQ